MPVCCKCSCWTPCSSWKCPMKYGQSVIWSCCLLGCFYGIGPLGFSELRHGVRNPYEVMHDRARLFKKIFFAAKNEEIGQK